MATILLVCYKHLDAGNIQRVVFIAFYKHPDVEKIQRVVLVVCYKYPDVEKIQRVLLVVCYKYPEEIVCTKSPRTLGLRGVVVQERLAHHFGA